MDKKQIIASFASPSVEYRGRQSVQSYQDDNRSRQKKAV